MSFFCLATLTWLLATRHWTRDTSYFPISLVLAALVTVGSRVSVSFLVLSPVVGFAYLLLRYAPSESVRPYRAVWESLRTRRAAALRDILIIAVAPPLSLAYFCVDDCAQLHSAAELMRTDPVHYAAGASRLFFQYSRSPEDLQSFVAPFTGLVLIGYSITVWWLFISI